MGLNTRGEEEEDDFGKR